MTQAAKHHQRWRPDHAVPFSLSLPPFVLEPLHEKHAELDFQALMSCRERLREELQWGTWPPQDFTLSLNRTDLQEHFGEFERGEAFAYTILKSDRTQCHGCLYIERFETLGDEAAQLAFWVTDDALDYETSLVTSALQWAHEVWGFKHVILPFRPTNVRGITLAQKLGLVLWEHEESLLPEHQCFLSSSCSC